MTCYNCKYFTFHPENGKEFCTGYMASIFDPWQYCDDYEEIGNEK